MERRLLKGVEAGSAAGRPNSGPILENVKSGDEIDMTLFPTPHWHELDGGRYIGTADCVITGEPEEGGWVNVGIYRVQVHDKNTLGFYVSPGHHARIMRRKVLGERQSCPVVVTFGQDPLLFLVAGHRSLTACPSSITAADSAARPCDVIRGEVTGLPIPATAEIAIEGEVPPPKNKFTWKVRSANGRATTPRRCQRTGHSSQEALLSQQSDSCGAPPLKPPFITFGVPIGAAAIWNYLEKADVPDIKGVWCYVGGSAAAGGAPFIVVSLKQRYHGHSQQAAIAALAHTRETITAASSSSSTKTSIRRI